MPATIYLIQQLSICVLDRTIPCAPCYPLLVRSKPDPPVGFVQHCLRNPHRRFLSLVLHCVPWRAWLFSAVSLRILRAESWCPTCDQLLFHFHSLLLGFPVFVLSCLVFPRSWPLSLGSLRFTSVRDHVLNLSALGTFGHVYPCALPSTYFSSPITRQPGIGRTHVDTVGHRRLVGGDQACKAETKPSLWNGKEG